MFRLQLIFLLVIGMVLRSLKLHLGLINEKGSADPETPYEINDLEFSQAVYARMEPGREVDYYSFIAEPGVSPKLKLLENAAAYNKHNLRIQMTITGPGLPPVGFVPPVTAIPFSVEHMDYMAIQVHFAPMPEAGKYLVKVERLSGEGVYCFVAGINEGKLADETTLHRIIQMLAADA
jgi:hypothetical protein